VRQYTLPEHSTTAIYIVRQFIIFPLTLLTFSVFAWPQSKHPLLCIMYSSSVLSLNCRVEYPAIGESAKMPLRKPRRAENGKHNPTRGGGLWPVCSLEDIRKKLQWEKSPTAIEAEAKVLGFEKSISGDGNGKFPSGNRGGAGHCVFQLPVHYPRYSKADYESMAEWKLDNLFHEYGLPIRGDLAYKRSYAIGAFLWPDQL